MAARTTPVPLFSNIAVPAGRAPAAHLVGIGGAGMKALAELLVGLGWKVTGSDLRASRVLDDMRRQGLRVFAGHDDSCLPPAFDLLAYSPAVGPENPERAEAARRAVPQFSLSELLGALMADRVGVAIAGTHGKSTTTAMVATLLRRAGRAPSAAFGAELCASRISGWAGDGELLVVEGCEYRRNFLALRPTHAAILNVEADHFDCYAGLADVTDAFSSFAALLPAGGVLVARADCASSVAGRTAARVVTFGTPAADYWAADLRPAEAGTRFRVFYRGEYLVEITLRMPGPHNVTNALAAIALCHELGVSLSAIRDGLWDFPGLARRFEAVGTWRGRLLIDDYAHHPTAVRAVLEATRLQYPGRRVWCAFQPHQVSRTVALLDQFAAALSLADGVLLAPIYAAREESSPAASSSRAAAEIASRLAQAINDAGVPARLVPSLDLLPDAVDHDTRPGDVLVTMGAGDIDRVHHEFSRRLRRHHAAG